ERGRRAVQLRAQPREVGLRGNFDVRPAEEVGVLNDVPVDHAEAVPLERTRDAGGTGERVDRDAAADAAPGQDVADEVEQPGLVADVAHRVSGWALRRAGRRCAGGGALRRGARGGDRVSRCSATTGLNLAPR